MDVTKVTAALKTAQDELNTATDEEFKARRLAGLRPLTLASNAIELAQKHLKTATDRTAPKGGEVPAGEQSGGEMAAAGAGAGKPGTAAARKTAAAK